MPSKPWALQNFHKVGSDGANDSHRQRNENGIAKLFDAGGRPAQEGADGHQQHQDDEKRAGNSHEVGFIQADLGGLEDAR